MQAPNLFTQLAGYSLNPHKRSIENFTTELLAHFFNSDLVFRRRFLAVIFDTKLRARPFRDAVATTQELLGRDCRVDLVLTAAAKRHLVEVKVTANETQSGRWGQRGKPQVQRYLDLKIGHVTYLTTRTALVPETDHRGRRYVMVKHAFLEDLYQAVRPSADSPLVGAFLDFMKQNDMAGPQGFSRKEIKRVNESMILLRKCLDSLATVRSEVNVPLRHNLRTYSNLTRPSYKGYHDGGEVISYLNKFHKRAVRWVGISILPDGKQLLFCVWMWGRLDPSIVKITRKLGWDEYDGAHGCMSCIPLFGTPNDIPRMVAHAIKASRKLGTAIRNYA